MMRRQFEIMHELAQIMFDTADEEFQRLGLEVEVNAKEGWTENSCWQSIDGETEYLSMDDEYSYRLMILSFELYEAMKKQTGGELEKFSIEIDEEGTAYSKLAYSNEPPQAS